MSAFVTLEGVIDDVVCLLMPSAMDGDEMANELGRKLWSMNVEAVQQRYQLPDDGDEMQGYRAAVASYTYVEPKSVGELQHYKSLSCLEYQCSEGSVPEQDLFKRISKLEDELDELHRHPRSRPGWGDLKWDRPRATEDMLRAFPDPA